MPENRINLGEADIPLLYLADLGIEFGFPQLFTNDKSIKPAGTFNARGLSAAILKARELGVRQVIIPTAGNAGGAMAAYAAPSGQKLSWWMG